MTETEELPAFMKPVADSAEPLTTEQKLQQSEARVAELESAMRAALTEAEQFAAPKKDFWKPLAIGACLASLLLTAGVGILARERQLTGRRYARASTDLADFKSRSEAAEKRVYDQNRELADFTSKLRDRDLRVGKLNAEVMRLNQKVQQVAKEREGLRTLISSKLNAVQPAPVVVSPSFTDNYPPQVRSTRRRRKRASND